MNDQELKLNEEEILDAPSKTRRKIQMEQLQDLGIELVKLPKDKLKQLELPQSLLDAIKLAQQINSNGAIRRQYQYIGKLKRSVDAESIASKLADLNGESLKSTQIFHLSESWRDKLLADDANLTQFADEYPIPDLAELRNLIRQVRKEHQLNQNRNYTKLFRLIRSIIEGKINE
jgi:ribosome-associated protein